MKKVVLALNPMEPETWTTHDVDDVRDFLMGQFEEWPSTARIHHEHVSSANDVTPSSEAEIDRLGTLDGTFYVIVYPADPVTIIIAIVAVVVVAAVVLQPSIPTPTLRNTQNQSPNNELSERSNKPRPLSRIPDIFGTVRSTPDLIAVPYKIFQDHEEVEYAYMCIGRGAYDVSDIRDDTTLAGDIAGTSVEVYAPNTSPNSGHAPQLRVGQAINTPLLDVVRSNAVNGQVLRPPNDQSIVGVNNIYFASPNEIRTSAFDFTDKFAAGDALTVTGATDYQAYINHTKTLFAYSNGFRFVIPNSTLPSEYAVGAEIQLTGALFSVTDPDGFWSSSYDLSGVYTIASKSLETVTDPEGGGTTYYCRVVLNSPASVNPSWNSVPSGASASVGIRLSSGAELYNLNGTYDVLSVADDTIRLSNPSAVNSNWATLSTSPTLSPILSTTGSKWVGPFVLDKKDTTQVFCNFVALNGLYKDDGRNQVRMDVTLELEVTPINADGSPRGAVQTFQATVEGSATFRSTRAITLKATPAISGRLSIRARRVTPSDLAFEGSVVDEIKWRDVYAVAPVTQTHFGDVTTVQSVTYATAGALALKERKLNMLATRKIPIRPFEEYRFSPNWLSYAGGIVSSYKDRVGVKSDGDSYGVFAQINSFSIGQVVTVTFTLEGESSATNIAVGLHTSATWASNNVTVGKGTHTVTLTATSAPATPRLAFFCSQANTNFIVSDVKIVGVAYPCTHDWLGYNFGVLTATGAGLSVVGNGSQIYGALAPLPGLQAGDKVIVTFTLANSSTASSVTVGLHTGGTWASATQVAAKGSTHTLTLTATSSPDTPYVLFLGGAGTNFQIQDITIRGEYFTQAVFPTNRADHILSRVCVDPHIGNRPLSEIDFNSFYNALNDARNYFASPVAAEFSYTFDSDNLSFEETAQSVANAVFCIAYRRGNIIKLNFERQTDNSTLLFNHRNKLPGSETRTVRFGNQNNFDGVAYQYTDPEDDALVTYYIPEDRSAINPKEIESLGVRSKLQAHFHAWRAWNKIRYQNVITEFQATQEADLLVPQDRILVADNTRSGMQDGEVREQNLLELKLSQPVVMQSGVNYTIFLQHFDGTVESIPVSAGRTNRHVMLSRAPRLPLATEDGLYARAGYILVGDNEPRENAFLLVEKSPQSNFTSTVRAVNYDDRYYGSDKDFVTGVVNSNGDYL